MRRRTFAQNTFLSLAAVQAMPFEIVASIPEVAANSFKKGIMWGNIGFGDTIADKFEAAKVAGFQGVEVMSHLDRNQVLEAKGKSGLIVPSVCGSMHGKYPLSDPDPVIRQLGLDALKVTLEDAKAYGADTILFVPGRVSDKVGYDECWERSTDGITKILPLAESLGVTIAIENVWNNFLLSPLEFARFIDQFKSSYLKAYFDCGNVLSIGWPEQWIRILGNRIARIHIKEYSRSIADKQGKWAGFNVALLEGDNRWEVIMKALGEIGYSGWTTVEQPGGETPAGLADLCRRLTSILDK